MSFSNNSLSLSFSISTLYTCIYSYRTNIRELFEVNKTETNPETIQSLINQGEKDIESLQIMLTARMETLTMLIAESNLTRGTSVKQETNEH